MSNLRHGHAPGHIRDTFCAAIDAFNRWKPGEPEPTVEFEVHNEPREILISQACGLVWKCTDILPGDCFDQMEETGPKSRSYAAGARAMLGAIKNRLATPIAA